MALFQDVALEGTAYFHFASNDTGGTAGDGASALFRVRLGGAASNAAPVYSGNPTLLTEATYPEGCYEVAIPATAVNGFAAGNTYGVFCTLTVDGENPAGLLGGLKVVATADTLHDAAAQIMDNLTVGTATLAQPGDEMTLTSVYDAAKAAAAVGAAMTLAEHAVNTTSIADAVVTQLANLDAAISSRGTADPGDEMTLTSPYDAAKTAAAAGAAMDLVDAPNATAVTAIQSGLAQPGDEMTLTSPYDAAKTAAQAGNEMAVSSHTTAAKAELQVEANDALVAYGAAQVGDEMTLTSAYDAAKVAAPTGEAASALTSYDAPTKAEMDTAHALLGTASALTTVSGNVDSILADTGTDGVIVKAAGLATDAVTEIATGILTAKIALGEGAGASYHATVGQVLALLSKCFKITFTDNGNDTGTIVLYQADGTTQFGSNMTVGLTDPTATTPAVVTSVTDTA